jgi:tetratricopeptide (TPR) repeat protein
MADFFHQRITSLEEQLSKEPQSPLFVRLASHYLQAGRAEDALRLCDEGLSQYPFYSTAHLIKGRALLELKMLAEAKREFQVVHDLLPNNEAVARLHASIDLGPSTDIGAAVAEEVATGAEAPPTETAPPQEGAVIYEPPPAAPGEPSLQEAPGQEHAAAPPEVTQEQDTFGAEPVAEEAQAFPSETPPSDDFSSFGEPPAAAAEIATSTFGEQPQPEATDFGFGAPLEAPPQAEQAPEEAQPSPAEPQAEFGTEQREEQSTVEPIAEEPAPPPGEVSAPEAPEGEPEQTPSWQDAFSQLEQPPQDAEQTAVTEQAQEENPFAAFGAEAPTSEGGVEEEPYDVFAARKRMEFFGSEDTQTLEEYLGSDPTGASPAEQGNGIEEIAEKLKTPKKITPVINFTEKAPRPASEADTPASAGFVTPTLAEIYVKQGWYDDAIKAYRALAANKPAEREKFDRRIAEIEELKKQQG